MVFSPMQTDRRAGRVLVVEDDPGARANLCDILEMDDYAVEPLDSLAEAFGRPSLEAVEVIIVDRQLPEGNALDFLPRLRARAPEAAVVIVTAHSDLEGAIEALRSGASDYILKPINADSLRIRIGGLMHRRRLALAKERSDSAFRNLVEAAESMVVMVRPDDHAILSFSPLAEQLSGYAVQEVLGKSYLELLVPAHERSQLITCCRKASTGLPQRQIESTILCRDGSTRFMLRNIRLLPDYDGSPALLIVGHDITELKRAQERALNSERMAAIGQMCAGLAHESRNALQRSQACLEMLELKLRDRPDLKNLIDRVQQAQDDLHRLYEDVREFAAPFKLSIVECDLAEIWRRAWSHLEQQHTGKRVSFLEPPPEVNLHCQADAFRLEQVFRNVLDNALAACAGLPEIVIQISTSAALIDDRSAIQICIRDNGPGLSSEQRDNIFESFFTTKLHGTGLGMAIVKRIVEAHGGRAGVGAGSRGTEIILTLPRSQGR
jgi:PAS domain S-box-containing protein